MRSAHDWDARHLHFLREIDAQDADPARRNLRAPRQKKPGRSIPANPVIAGISTCRMAAESRRTARLDKFSTVIERVCRRLYLPSSLLAEPRVTDRAAGIEGDRGTFSDGFYVLAGIVGTSLLPCAISHLLYLRTARTEDYLLPARACATSRRVDLSRARHRS